MQIAPKIYRLTLEACATVRATETGAGLLWRDLEPWLRELMRSEMESRPMRSSEPAAAASSP